MVHREEQPHRQQMVRVITNFYHSNKNKSRSEIYKLNEYTDFVDYRLKVELSGKDHENMSAAIGI